MVSVSLFHKGYPSLKAALCLPDTIPTYDRMKVDGVETLCMILNVKRLDECLGKTRRQYMGFVNVTARPVSRPGKDQQFVYNEHKKVHALKSQSIVLPNRLIGNLFGPIEGRRHECFLQRKSNLLTKLNVEAKCIQQ